MGDAARGVGDVGAEQCELWEVVLRVVLLMLVVVVLVLVRTLARMALP